MAELKELTTVALILTPHEEYKPPPETDFHFGLEVHDVKKIKRLTVRY